MLANAATAHGSSALPCPSPACPVRDWQMCQTHRTLTYTDMHHRQYSRACACMRAAVRAQKMEDRQSTDIRARQSPKSCMDEANATSANSTGLVKFTEVASATCSSGATLQRLRNNEHKSKVHVCVPHVRVPRLQKSQKSSTIHLSVVLRSTVKRLSQMRDRGGTGRNTSMQFSPLRRFGLFLEAD